MSAHNTTTATLTDEEWSQVNLALHDRIELLNNRVQHLMAQGLTDLAENNRAGLRAIGTAMVKLENGRMTPKEKV